MISCSSLHGCEFECDLPYILSRQPLASVIRDQGTYKSFHLREKAKASRQRGVCVNHLKRCKTSTFRSYFHDFEFFVLTSCRTSILNYTQGVVAGSRVYHQRRRSGFPGDTWPDQPCVPASFLGYGTWLTQRPPCRFQQTGFLFCTVFAI